MCYDAYARVCMSLGMNAMLQALSYYIIGRIARQSLVSALACLVGVQLIIFLLLQLDISASDGAEGTQSRTNSALEVIGQTFSSWIETGRVVLLVSVPPALALTLSWFWPYVAGYPSNPGSYASRTVRSWIAVLCFWLHAGWLIYIYREGRPRYEESEANEIKLPKRLRVLAYMNVISLEQQKMIENDRAKKMEVTATYLDAARKRLETVMAKVCEDELREETMSLPKRNERTLKELASLVNDKLQRARERITEAASSGPELEVKTQRAQKIVDEASYQLDKLAIWQNQPVVFAKLLAMYRTVESGETDLEFPQQEEIKAAYTKFLDISDEILLSIRTTAGAPLQVGDLPLVRVDRINDTGRLTRTYVGGDNGVQMETPSNMVYFDTAMRAYVEAVLDMNTLSIRRSTLGPNRDVPQVEMENVDGVRPQPRATRNPFNIMPPGSRAPHKLPGRVVQSFIVGFAAVWIFASVCHMIHLLFYGVGSTTVDNASNMHGALEMQRLQVPWPAPVSLFEISALHCNDSSVLVSNRVALFAAQRLPWEAFVGELAEASASPAAAVLCGAAGCDALRAAGTAWELAPLAGGTPSALALPESWRAVAAARGAPCAPGSCTSLLLAGWDGTEVVIADAKRAATDPSAWRLRPRFMLRPELGACGGANGADDKSCVAPSVDEAYDDVRALHLAEDGERLAVLLGSGLLHVWDLTAGSLVGRWRAAPGLAGRAAVALCGSEVLVGRRGTDGPLIEASFLPAQPSGKRLVYM